MRFKTVEADVIPLLKKHSEARYDDMYLYYLYIRKKGIQNMTNIFKFNRTRLYNGVAPYETVSRVRRKLQEHYPELKPTKAQIEKKKKTEQEYKLYAKGVKQ